MECRGGADNPCYNHGECSTDTGRCTCHRNWLGSADCDMCSSGWEGSDCSIAQMGRSRPNQHCGALVNGYYSLLSGSGIQVKETGIFSFYETRDGSINIELLQAPCGGFGMCVLAVALEIDGHNLLLKVSGDSVETYLDDSLKVVQYGFDIGSSDYRLRRPNNIKYIIEGPDSFSLEISKMEIYLNIDLKTSVCSGVTGICGDCSALDENLSQADINSDVQQQDLISAEIETLMGDTIISNKAGYALYLNGMGAVSKRLPADLYETTDGFITIEITAKIMRAEGVLMSFASKDLFVIILKQGLIGFQYQNEVKMTKFEVDIRSWIRLGIVYDIAGGSVVLHHITENGIHKYETVSSFENVFESEATLSIGQGQIVQTNNSVAPVMADIDNSFQGYVDRVIIWKFRFSPADILRHSTYYILKTEPNLGVVWNFDESYGEYSYDRVESIAMKLPPNAWVTSGAPVTKGEVSTDISSESGLNFKNEEFKGLADAKCSELLNYGDLGDECGTEAYRPAYDFYYLQCMSVVGESGNLNNAIDAVIAMSNLCEDRESVFPVDELLCNQFPERHYGNVYGESCDQQCLYGKR